MLNSKSEQHPNGLANAWKNSPEALAGTAYAKVFKEGSPSDPDVFFGMPMTAETLSGWVTDPSARQVYVEALGRSSFDGMLAYYKRNYFLNGLVLLLIGFLVTAAGWLAPVSRFGGYATIASWVFGVGDLVYMSAGIIHRSILMGR